MQINHHNLATDKICNFCKVILRTVSFQSYLPHEQDNQPKVRDTMLSVTCKKWGENL
ncbi:hypothetical protein NIES4101_68690 [Calothrix sp. NIES-4101]|nr:hypothetical protein NIES4101_68690 [Calothrix sp. NIES-4101]